MRTPVMISKLAARVTRLEKTAAAARTPHAAPPGEDSGMLSFLGSAVVGAAIPIVVFGASATVVRLVERR